VGWEFHYWRVHLHTWPDFIGMPAEQSPVIARICALVNRGPTVESLIPLILNFQKEQPFTALEYLGESRAHTHMHPLDTIPTASARWRVIGEMNPLSPEDMSFIEARHGNTRAVVTVRPFH